LTRYGMWACGRYEEVKTIFSDWQRFSSSRGVGLSDFKLETPWRPPSIILEVDPPEHKRTRTVMMNTLSSRALASLIDGFQAHADLLVDRLLGVGEFDAVPDLAQAFPLKVFPDAVGLADGDRENLLIYANMVFNALGPDNQIRRDAMAQAGPVQSWIAEHCERGALAPGGFGESIYAAADSGDITEEEAGLLVRSLLSAGLDTTVAGFGNLLLCLARHPDQWATLKQNPDLIPNVFEEVLRFTSPVHTFCRTANANTTVSDIPIREGDKILCVLAAANLDAMRWQNPDVFDITRKSTGHVALGMGVHACVGRQVARFEARALLGALVSKVDRIELCGEPKWRPGNALTTLASLPISFERAV
jgi:cytochrome P450